MVLVVAFLLPNHYPPWLTFHSEIAAALAFAPIMIWAVLGCGPMPALTLGTLFVAIVPVVQVLFGHVYFAGDGWVSLLYLSGFALVVLAGYRWISETQSVEPLSDGLLPLWGALMLAGYLSTAIAFRQWLDPGPMGIYGVDMPPGGRPFGNLAQPNQLATLLLLAVVSHIALFEAGRLSGTMAIVGVFFLAGGVALTGSRSVLLALAWLWPAFLLMRRRCRLRTRATAVLGVTLFYAVIMTLWPQLNDALLLTSDTPTALDRLDSPGVRTVYWKSMLDAISRTPWLGYGWSQVGLAQTETALDHPATHSYFYNSHNLFLDLFLWNGVPLGLSVIVGLVVWFGWQFRQCRDSFSWCALIAIGLVFSHAMVEYPLSYAYFLLPVGLWMGALSARHPSTIDLKCNSWLFGRQRMLARGVGLLTMLLFVKIGWEYQFWEQDWRDLRFQEAHIGDPHRGELPTFILLTQLDELMKFSRTEARPGMQAPEIDWMRRTSGRFGHSSGMYRYALALALNDRTDEASRALRRLCQMHPEKICQSAQRNWADLVRTKYPQLAVVQFPIQAIPPTNRNVKPVSGQ